MKEIPSKVKNKKLVEQRREKIVLAAIKLFSKSGFHTTTMRELAVEAEISSGNIYEYVTTKEDIFFLIHDFIHNIAIDGIKQAIKGVRDPLEKLRRMIRSEFNMNYNWTDAVLLIYQETHILTKPLLHELLKKEREHVSYYEKAIEECIEKGLMKKTDTRLLANLVKTMTEAWVVKRWDLRGYVDRMEMEKTIIGMIFDYLKGEASGQIDTNYSVKYLGGKTALVVNGETLIAKAVTRWLLSRGVNVSIYKSGPTKDLKIESPIDDNRKDLDDNIIEYTSNKHGMLDKTLFKSMQQATGPFNYIIYDLSTYFSSLNIVIDKNIISQELESNLTCARNLISEISTDNEVVMPTRVIYIAPWGWDGYADPLMFGMVKSGLSTLVEIMAEQLAPERVIINCISPGFIGGVRPLKIEKKKKEDILEKLPMGRIGEVSDVLGAVKYLLSDDSKYVTGQTIDVAGGFSKNAF